MPLIPKPQAPDRKQDSLKPIVAALRGEKLLRPPIWLMRQAGRYLPEYREVRAKAGGFLELCFTPELAAEVTLQPVRRFGVDGAILFSDILVVPYGLGQSLRFSEGEGPLLDPILDEAGVGRLTLDGFEARLNAVFETVKRVASLLPDETSLIGFAGAPWTVASYMIAGKTTRDFTDVKLWAHGHDVLFRRLIALLVDATVAYLKKQIEAGAEVLQLFDSWAGALSETERQAWCIEPISEIATRLKAEHPKIPIIGFPRGIGAGYGDFIARTKVDGIGLDQSVPLSWAARTLQPHATVQGNLDPVLVAAGGEGMISEAKRILECFGAGPFIFNLGHGVMQQTPPESVAALVDYVHRWRARG